MPYTVRGAFDAYRKNTVDLIASDVSTARTSRDYLFEQLKTVAGKISGFPKLYGQYLSFGSFARNTKTRPLDDIDILLLLDGKDTTAERTDAPYTYKLKVKSTAPLGSFVGTDPGYVNSTRILNKIRDSLSTVANYSKADIKKTMQAVSLNLKSYTWSFDIVPAVPIGDGKGGTAYYLIPDGKGQWIRTDPRIDRTNTTSTNVRHGGEFVRVVRLLKMWNRRTTKPVLTSYHLETLAFRFFTTSSTITSYQEGVKRFFDSAQTTILLACLDPKGLGPNLDVYLSPNEKQKISAAMKEASENARLAIYHEGREEHKAAIAYWKKVFGSSFPDYG